MVTISGHRYLSLIIKQLLELCFKVDHRVFESSLSLFLLFSLGAFRHRCFEGRFFVFEVALHISFVVLKVHH